MTVATEGPDDPVAALPLLYAPAGARAAVAALLSLDARLGAIVRAARDPLVGQMRLAWWRDALERWGEGAVPAEPLLRALADAGQGGGSLAVLIDGWERLLVEGTPSDVALRAYGEERGGRLFALIAAAIATSRDPRTDGGPRADRDASVGGPSLLDAGAGWALADLALHRSQGTVATNARALAVPLLAAATRRRWPRHLRVLGALALTAEGRLQGHAPPRQAARLLWHRLTGR